MRISGLIAIGVCAVALLATFGCSAPEATDPPGTPSNAAPSSGDGSGTSMIDPADMKTVSYSVTGMH